MRAASSTLRWTSIIYLADGSLFSPAGQVVRKLIYVPKCSGRGDLNSVSLLRTYSNVWCVYLWETSKNRNSDGQHSAYHKTPSHNSSAGTERFLLVE